MVAWFINADGATYTLPVVAYRVDPNGIVIEAGAITETLASVDACVCLTNGTVAGANDEGEPAPGYMFVGTYPAGADPREIDPHQITGARAEAERLRDRAQARRATRQEATR